MTNLLGLVGIETPQSTSRAALVGESAALAAVQLRVRALQKHVKITRSDGQEIEFDAVLSESHDDAVDVTELPVELGAPVSDHMQPRPTVVTLSGVLSDTPIVYGGAFTGAADSALGKYDNADTRYKALQEIASKREIVRLWTPRREYEKLALTSLTGTMQQGTGGAIEITLTLKELHLVKAEVVAAPTKQAKDVEADLGKQPVKAPRPAVAAQGESVLYSLGKAIVEMMLKAIGG